MMIFNKHHNEHLDNTRGKWRGTLLAGLIGTDGHPASWNEHVVFSCPSCGCIQGLCGVDGNEIPVQPDGTTADPARCHHCGWMDVCQFEKHAEAEGRSHFNKLKEGAQKEVNEARIRKVHKVIRDQMQAELDEKALAEAKKILPDGGNHQELFRDFMKGKQ